MSGAVVVAARVRPRVGRADMAEGVDAFDFLGDPKRTIATREGIAHGAKSFTFDSVFPPDSTQQQVFDLMAKPLVDSALDGFNATIFAYGQTGSGKTHTMTGNAKDPGLTPRMVTALFEKISASASTLEFTIRMSYLEIYMERVRDLLNPGNANLAIREDRRPGQPGVYVEGCTEEYVASPDELMALVRTGEANRVVGATGMNEHSSRSHSVIMMLISSKDTSTGTLKMSKLCLVDLAGSEQVARTGAEGHTLEEAKTINKSLFTLSKCISTLAQVAENEQKVKDSGETARKAALHVPYRDSKLTRLLQESLGGNARTALVVCCSPCSSNITESISTLRFGSDAKRMQNKPVVNKRRSVEELERLLSKAEVAIDAQAKMIAMLQGQIADLSEQVEDLGGIPGQFARQRSESSLEGDDAAAPPPHHTQPPPPHAGAASMPTSPPSSQQHHHNGNASASSDVLIPSVLDASGDDGDHWGDPSSWAAASPSKSPSAAGAAGRLLVPHGGGGTASGAGIESPASPSNRTISSIGNAAHSLNSLIAELAAARSEIASLKEQGERDAEDLLSRAEEIRAVTVALESKESQLAKLQSERDLEVSGAREHGGAAAIDAVMSAIRSHACGVCNKQPFAELKQLQGVATLHEQQCFEASQARAASKRFEDRVVSLSAEVTDLKTIIDGLKAQLVAATAGAAAKPEASLQPQQMQQAVQHPKTLVDVRVAQDLHGKLAALIQVHRQLLRKYAVVDVEAAEMVETLKARDGRIVELHRAAVAQAERIESIKAAYEERLEKERKESEASVSSVRSEFESKLEALRTFYEHRFAQATAHAAAAASSGANNAQSTTIGRPGRVVIGGGGGIAASGSQQLAMSGSFRILGPGAGGRGNTDRSPLDRSTSSRPVRNTAPQLLASDRSGALGENGGAGSGNSAGTSESFVLAAPGTNGDDDDYNGNVASPGYRSNAAASAAKIGRSGDPAAATAAAAAGSTGSDLSLPGDGGPGFAGFTPRGPADGLGRPDQLQRPAAGGGLDLSSSLTAVPRVIKPLRGHSKQAGGL